MGRGAHFDKAMTAAMVFLLMATIWLTVLVALAPIMPLLALLALVVWIVVRRPFKYPDRLDGDLDVFCQNAVRVVRRIVESLRPKDGWD